MPTVPAAMPTISDCRSGVPARPRRRWLTRGVPVDAIATAAFGETRPRVATADGVRQQENRRVEIEIR